MIIVAGTYISDITFEKSYDGLFNIFSGRQGILKDTFFTGREENGKMKITGNRQGLSKSVNDESRVIQIENYINEVYKS